MSLITCTECGKEFSDKASACPNCGCPIEAMENQSAPNEAVLEEIYTLYPSKAYGIKEYMRRTNCSMNEAKVIIGEFYDKKKPDPVKFQQPTQDRFVAERLAEQAEREKQKDLEDPNKIVCPKCKSNNIQIFDKKKKMSLGKGVLGTALFGVPGAIVGGAVIGKEGKHNCVCMSCSHTWKIK